MRCSTLFVSRTMRVKTTMRYHMTPTVTGKADSNKCWQECGDTGTPTRWDENPSGHFGKD